MLKDTHLKVLIVGNGGREHALAWKIRASPQVATVFVAPGNAGTALESGIENVPIPVHDIEALLQFAKTHAIDLTIIGPELPLTLGITDLFNAQGLLCFGPTKAASKLESSKLFSKRFMVDNKIPTPAYASFTELEAAVHYLSTCTYPVVIKADGLATGKGVIIAHTCLEATEIAHSILAEKRFGEAGNQIIIEDFIAGEELSFIVLTDGKIALPLATSQDHKARDNGDQGPNTGGMGAYSPAPVATPTLQDKIMQTVIYPTLRGMAERKNPYQGFLYAGIMITPSGEPVVLEFNCRLGDPEAQVILMRLKTDLIKVCIAALQHKLDSIVLSWDTRATLGVVMAAKGYPDQYAKGDILSSLPQEKPTDFYKIFHAGTCVDKNSVKTNGGRVLCVTVLGESIQSAQTEAYKIVEKIAWGNHYYRTDIGYKAIDREKLV